MKKYAKTLNDTMIIKSQRDIIIYKNNKQIINPTHEMILNDGWIEYINNPIEVFPSEEELLEDAKMIKIREIEEYDQSTEVNCFYVNGMPMWLDKATRAGLILRFNAEMDIGNTDTTLWYNSMEFPLPLNNAIKMLYALELYASQCYDNTQKHIANIKNMQSKKDVENYDFRQGYPIKLNF